MQNDSKYYQMLGLDSDADRDKVKQTYTILLKKHKDDPEKLKEIDEAYNQVMGFYVENEEEEEKAKTNAGKFGNFWYHNKWPTIAIVLATVALVILVVNSINNVPSDINLHFVGDVYVTDINQVYDNVYENLEEAQQPLVDELMLSDRSPIEMEMQTNTRMKLTTLIASGSLDVIVSDMKTFKYLAEQGVFMPLSVVKDEEGKYTVSDGRKATQNLLGDSQKSKNNTTEKENKEFSGVYAVDNFGEKGVYGVSLENTEFFDFSNVTGNDLVVSMFYEPAHHDLAFKLINLILNEAPK